MKRQWQLVFLLGGSLALAPGLRAQEHPQEHPKKQEHPASKPVTMGELETAIRAQVEDAAKKAGGHFPVPDNVLNKTWKLELVRVHTDKLAHLKDNVYFACVDFRAQDGQTVDVDFYLKQKDGKLQVTDTTVHKVEGKARFAYEQEGDNWKRVPAS